MRVYIFLRQHPIEAVDPVLYLFGRTHLITNEMQIIWGFFWHDLFLQCRWELKKVQILHNGLKKPAIGLQGQSVFQGCLFFFAQISQGAGSFDVCTVKGRPQQEGIIGPS